MENNNSGGIGFGGMLQVLFIGLKLTGHINWSWWWVFSPTLFGISFLVFILIFVLLVNWQ